MEEVEKYLIRNKIIFSSQPETVEDGCWLEKMKDAATKLWLMAEK